MTGQGTVSGYRPGTPVFTETTRALGFHPGRIKQQGEPAMPQVVDNGDGSTTVTLDAVDDRFLKGAVAERIPFVSKAAAWFGDIDPALHEAEDFLRNVASAPAGGSSFSVTPGQKAALGKVLSAHVPWLEGVLAVAESAPVRQALTLAKALL
jgi:hypothetical protein